MNNIILKLKRMSLNSNSLKLIAIITMLIDHIGYYFRPYINNILYYILRAVGRISMPIFAFLIVQGFFHTKDIKKYIIRIFSIAVITQIIIFIVSIFDKNRYSLSVNTQLNILFSYALSLIILWLIHNGKVSYKLNRNQNLFAVFLLIMVIIGIYLYIPIDYEVYAPILILLLYFIEKLRITIYMQKQNYTVSIKKMLISTITEDQIKICYIVLIFLSLLLVIIESKNKMYWYMLFSIIPIYMYNGQRGRKDKKLDILLYLVFPVQHFLLYLFSII